MSSVEVSLNLVEQQHHAEDGSSTVSGDDDHRSSTSGSDTRSMGTELDAGISDKATKRIQIFRAGLILVLLTGAGICAATYLFVQDELMNDFKLSFSLFANSIEASLGHHVENLEVGVRNLGGTITASADAVHAFPFVTVDKFEVHGEHARARSKLEAMTYAPLVSATQKEEWEEFAAQHQDWINASRTIFLDRNDIAPVYLSGNVSPFVYHLRDGIFVEPTVHGNDDPDAVYAPIWYLTPPPFNPAIVNFDAFSHVQYQAVLEYAIRSKGSAFSPVMNVEKFLSLQVSDEDHFLYHQQFTNITEGIGYEQPHSLYAQAVFADSNNKNVVGVLTGVIAWDVYLADLLPEGVNGVIFVFRSTCGGEEKRYTYELNGITPVYLGEGDFHDHSFSNMVRRIDFFSTSDNTTVSTEETKAYSGVCSYSAELYPSKTFQQAYESNIAIIATCTVGATFAMVTLIFIIYDTLVNRRNMKVRAMAERSNAVVSSLFPATVRDRLMQVSSDEKQKSFGSGNNSDTNQDSVTRSSKKPIADLFPDVTIMFADIVGFTAWSSMREPCQVFELLETLYSEFDEIAKRRRVFKVETVGDCYVAVAGLPQPRADHAIVMTRFAWSCVQAFQRLVKQLEVSLGPDTADLGVRVGLHSGPVTAGVLRGERARFQLFGDSMNTTARIESNGASNRIHCSEETANLLIAAGKGHWVVAREDKIHAKGKGELQTYWIDNISRGRSSSAGSFSVSDSDNFSVSHEEEDVGITPLSDKNIRLVEWNVEVLHSLLKRVVAGRAAMGENTEPTSSRPANFKIGGTPSEEVAEIITIPKFSSFPQPQQEDIVKLPEIVIEQLRAFVSSIAAMYNDNAFHNFEHASHVTMSVTKLLSRIVAGSHEEETQEDLAATLHDHTYGITSDPLTQFACVFSALIHDVDHQGVPNSQLVKENAPLVAVYGTSPAEQNSIDLSWELLMQDNFQEFRNTLCATNNEFARFRQLVVNAVMATDIMDKDLKALRNARWEAAFHESHTDQNHHDTMNRKATIVIEHCIQASDVAHTMQHWHIYRKWNERLFTECYNAYRNGRASSDPSVNWYKGEMGFFDFYIIPLAKKLKDCGVFGVSSDEYLKYAEANRKEWEDRGVEVVASMLERAQKQWAEKEKGRSV